MSKKLGTLLVLLGVLVFLGIMNWLPQNSIEILTPLNSWINILSIGCLILCIPLLFIKKKVGNDDLKINNFSYFSMIFTCGTGVGLLSWAFLEPFQLAEYSDCHGPLGLAITHWTLVPWGIFALFSVFELLESNYHILPKWMKTPKDIIYSLVMILGIATTYAIGTTTLTDSLFKLSGIEISPYVFLVLLTFLTAVSVLLGIHKGLKTFSNIVLGSYFLYLVVMILLGPDFLDSMRLGLTQFCNDFFYNHSYRGSSLQNDWTVFYWIWFISWVPFTAKFVAQISQGRSIRSVVACTLIMPTILTIIHLVAGYDLTKDLIGQVSSQDITSVVLGSNWILAFLFIFLEVGFFVTSADSLTLALDDSMYEKSRYSKPARKIFWIGLVCTTVVVLMAIGGGSVKIIQGLSFMFSPLILIIGLIYIGIISYRLIKNRKL